ncbi:23194_t:CDS:2, partial [Rhizophagus irregularis]
NLHDNDESELSDDCEIDLSTAINKASSEIQKINEQLEENLENEEKFNDCYSQIQLLDKMTVIDLVKEGCNILTHHIPSNIVYHISETKVLIDSNMLKLVGDEKKYYDEYFGRDDIIEKMKKY